MKDGKVERNKKMAVLVLALAVAFILSSSFLPAVEAVESDEGNESISSGNHWSYMVDLSSSGGGISYTIDDINGGSVNVILMDSDNYARYLLGETYSAIEEDDDISWTVSESLTLDAGTYVLVVENAGGSDVSFHYSVKYGADYTPSFWEGLLAGGLLGGATCIVSIIVLLIWLYVLVWVYKDAKRRGKSGALWLLIVFFFSILGLIVWLIVRPPIQQQVPYQQYQQPYQGPPPQQPYQAQPPQQPYQQYPPQQPPQQGVPNMPKRCPNCGMEVDPSWNTCPNCGARLH